MCKFFVFCYAATKTQDARITNFFNFDALEVTPIKLASFRHSFQSLDFPECPFCFNKIFIQNFSYSIDRNFDEYFYLFSQQIYQRMYSYRKHKNFNSNKKLQQESREQLNQISSTFLKVDCVEKAQNQYQSQYNRWESLRNHLKNMSVEDSDKGSFSIKKYQPKIKKQQSAFIQGNKAPKIHPNVQSSILRKIESSQNCRKKVYKSHNRPVTSRSPFSFSRNSQEVKLPFKSYKIPKRNKKKMFRSSLNDMRKIQLYNMEGGEEIAFRRILFRKSLIVETKMYAIQASSIQKSIIFTCQTMGETFSKTKLAIGPSELKDYSEFFLIFETGELAERIFHYLKLDHDHLKIDKEAIKKQQQAGRIIKMNKIEIEEKDQKNPEELRQSQVPIEQSLHFSKKMPNESKLISEVQEDSVIRSQIVPTQQMSQSKIKEQFSASKPMQ